MDVKKEPKMLLFDGLPAPTGFVHDLGKFKKLTPEKLGKVVDLTAVSMIERKDVHEELQEIQKSAKLNKEEFSSILHAVNHIIVKLSWKTVTPEIVLSELKSVDVPDSHIQTILTVFKKHEKALVAFQSERHSVVSPSFDSLRWRVSLQYQDNIRPPIIEPIVTIAISCTPFGKEENESFVFEATEDEINLILDSLTRAKQSFDKLKSKLPEVLKILP